MADSENKVDLDEEPVPSSEGAPDTAPAEEAEEQEDEPKEEEVLLLQEEGEEFVEEEEEEEEVYYNTEEFISQPYLSEHCTLPDNIVQFDYSFGYDCKRYFNLCVMNRNILIFASGNLIHFLNADTGRKWYRRCFSGFGIGHITTNPKQPHVAVGEKGENPLIIIYEWPSFDIVTILRRGTKNAYSHLNYSPDGELLCSQGSYPDYMLTIWNWRKHRILLRAKAYGQEVFNSRFSLYVPGHLTTSGTSHIKFWKINRTFTGLKLQGELGRFGKSEICNIVGFLALPDEKVVSGCEWGNILVWDAGLIRVEVFRRGKANCHEAPITQLIYNNGELTTVAMDGTIKVWYYETIELADPPEEDKFIEVEPIFEFEIGDYYHKAELMVIVKCDDNPENQDWFGQDGNGGIWKLDLSTALNARPPAQIFHCHAGQVVAVQASPFSPHIASLGKDGRLFLYDYAQKQMILEKEFMPGGCCLFWLPLYIESSGTVLIGGFDDGVIRIVSVSLHECMQKIQSPTNEYINLIQVSKPHTKRVTVITTNPSGTILVTGSEDGTIFIYKLTNANQFIELMPLGYTPVSGPVTCCSWKPNEEATVLVGCGNGSLSEIVLPQEMRPISPVSYLLPEVKTQTLNFVSVKSEIRRNLKLAEIETERAEIIEQKRKQLQKIYEENPGIDIDEEAYFAFEEEEPALPPLYIPEKPNPILFALYTPADTIWLSMGGYDAGYMYEYKFDYSGPFRSTLIRNADDVEINSYHYYHNEKYLILGMQDGRICIVDVNPQDHTDLSNYWLLSMHDNDNGVIPQICFNFNYQYMFTCGSDGNIFSYLFRPPDNDLKRRTLDPVLKGFPTTVVQDIDDPKTMSLEETKNKIEYDARMKVANAYKQEVLETLKGLEKKYEALLRRNEKLPKSQQFSPEQLILDQRIVDDLQKHLKDEMDLVKRKTAFALEKSRYQFEKLKNYFLDPVEIHTLQVHGIVKMDRFVETFRLQKLGPEFENRKKLVLKKIEDQEAKGRAQARLFSEEEVEEVITRRPNPAEALLKQIMSVCGDYKRNIKLRRLLRKYRQRKEKLENRRIEWHEMTKKKPDPNKPDPEDIAAIEYAKESIGDYKLKTAADYKVPKHLKITTVTMYDVLLKTRERIYTLKKEYNQQVLDLRERKLKMIERHQFLREVLAEIAKEIPKEKILNPPNVPTYIEDVEFPEKKLMWTDKDIFDELPKRYQNLYEVPVVQKKEIKPLDREYEMLILEKKGQKLGKVHSTLSLMKFSGITGPQDIEELEEAGKDDQIDTPWEKECRKLRVIKRLYEQDGIIEELETSISEFDEDICRLNEAKLQVEVDVKFLELYLLTVHQEVLILKKFEAAEEEKENALFEKLQEKHDMQKKMNEINNRVEARNREIRRCEEEIKNLVTTFMASIADQKFFDFLRRIFKKKYKPPKVKSDDSESDSESDSDSTSEEEDAKSLDSKDMGPIRMDESVCPQGCDPALYEMTFQQRAARHKLELVIIEEKKQIEGQKKEYEILLKKIKLVESQYQSCKHDLEEFMREKQRNLNEVETVVVLRLSQFQNFKNPNELEKLSESVVFSSSALSKLYQRVGELEKETQQQQAKHAKNRQHLLRMKIDIKHMKQVIVNMQEKIGQAMLRKFGTKVDIDDLEESLLKRLVAEMHCIILELERELEKKLSVLREKLTERQEIYAMKVQENTERYNLLTVLEEEKTRLKQAIQKQEKMTAAMTDTALEEELQTDIEKLEKMAKLQEEKATALKLEIRMLKMKVRPMPPISGAFSTDSPEMIQRIMIKNEDGELEEISPETRDELRDIYGEAQEIAQDVREGEARHEDYDRLRRLTGEFIQRLPVRCREAIIRKLSQKKIEEHQVPQRSPAGVLQDIVRSIPMESFLETIEIIGEIVESITSQFETTEGAPPPSDSQAGGDAR